MPDQTFFKRSKPHTIEYLAKASQSTIANCTNPGDLINDVSPLELAGKNDITFFSNVKYKKSLMDSKAGACILHPKHQALAPKTTRLLLSENPYVAYAIIATLFYPDHSNLTPTISDRAFISDTASIGKHCTIEAGAVIGNNVTIGDHSVIGANAVIKDNVIIGSYNVIHANVTITHAILSDHVTVHTGTRIGQDGFGFATHNGQHISVPQLGRVLIGTHVNIGANCCIDRGSGHDTIIGDGCRLDNLIQIGHNVHLGKGCVVVSHVGISGSTKCGDYVVIGGQAGIAGHLEIGSFVNVAAQAGVMHNLDPKAIVGGSPAVPIKQWHRQTIALKRLTSIQGSNND